MNSINKLFYFVCLTIVLIKAYRVARVEHKITWNSEKFSSGKIFYKNVKIGEYMDITCPQYDVDETNIMTFVVYNVTKQVFESCGKINEGALKLLDCNRSSKRTKLSIIFQKSIESQNPGRFHFTPKESYYFMANSNNNENETSHPNCTDKTRMQIRIHPKRQFIYRRRQRYRNHAGVFRSNYRDPYDCSPIEPSIVSKIMKSSKFVVLVWISVMSATILIVVLLSYFLHSV